MFGILSRYWWVLVARGLIAILFGILAFVLPEATGRALVIAFGVFAAADGVLAFFAGFTSIGEDSSWWVLALHGLLGIGIGLLTLFRPGITAIALIAYVAFWAIFVGTLQLVAAIRLRRAISGEFWLALGGVLAILFGALVLFRPMEGALVVVWMLGAFALAYGTMLLAAGVRVHQLRRLAP
jgi:uncharacterized membrane protein HdeD (DUF308 family)